VCLTVSHGHIDQSRRASPSHSVGESHDSIVYWFYPDGASVSRPTVVTGEILNLWYWFYMIMFLGVAPWWSQGSVNREPLIYLNNPVPYNG